MYTKLHILVYEICLIIEGVGLSRSQLCIPKYIYSPVTTKLAYIKRDRAAVATTHQNK